MGTKNRSPDQTSTSLSLEKDLLDAIDARAKKLGLSRSLYLTQLARADLAQGGDIAIKELHVPAPAAPAPSGKTASYLKSKKRNRKPKPPTS